MGHFRNRPFCYCVTTCHSMHKLFEKSGTHMPYQLQSVLLQVIKKTQYSVTMSFLKTPRMTVESSNSSVVILTVFSAAAKVSFSQSSQNKMVVALSFDCLSVCGCTNMPHKNISQALDSWICSLNCSLKQNNKVLCIQIRG